MTPKSMRPMLFGPTYEEMLNPQRIEPDVRERALQIQPVNELDPLNLFNITWKDRQNRVRRLVLPPELTGVQANIIVMLGRYFPSGSHKVGPAYATLMEGVLDGEIVPGVHNILGPSTGNFGIGVAYICKLMGLHAVIIMPDNMSRERYERITGYGAELDLTPGSESDVILTLQRTHLLMKDPKNRALAQFELFPNYRFHRFVTGNSAIEAAADVGNGKIACFVSAPGSAGTLAAGDQIKVAFPEAAVVAVEPSECATLSTGGRGQHRIEGIGDKMCTLIHNVRNTDFVAVVHDEACVKGLKVLQDGTDALVRMGVPRASAVGLRGMFGVSGVANILASIKMAKFLGLGPADNVVTVATDGFDRYPSVLSKLEASDLGAEQNALDRWFTEVFAGMNDEGVFDFRGQPAKERLYRQKENDWVPFGYSREYLDAMRAPEFWENEFDKIATYDQKVRSSRLRASAS